MKLRKFKLEPKSMTAEVHWTEEVEEADEVQTDAYTCIFAHAVHPDLHNALKCFIPHLLILTELRDEKDFIKSSCFHKEEDNGPRILCGRAYQGLYGDGRKHFG